MSVDRETHEAEMAKAAMLRQELLANLTKAERDRDGWMRRFSVQYERAEKLKAESDALVEAVRGWFKDHEETR